MAITLIFSDDEARAVATALLGFADHQAKASRPGTAATYYGLAARAYDACGMLILAGDCRACAAAETERSAAAG